MELRGVDFTATAAAASAPSLTLICEEGVHGKDGRLRRENLLSEHAVNFGIGVEAGILQDDAAVIQVGGAPQRGERDAAGGNSEEHQIFDAARTQNQVQLVLGERADALFIHDEIFRTSHGAVECSGWRADDEKIVVLQPVPTRLRIRKFGMPWGKTKPYMDNEKVFLARKIHGLGRVWDDRLGRRDKSENPILEIERQQGCLFWFQFHVASFMFISTTQDITVFTSVRGGAILPGLRDGGASMRNKTLAVSLFTAVLAVILSFMLAIPAFAAGDDKPAAPAPTATYAPSATPAPSATRPDREKKVYTNDDIDQMWPKEQGAANAAPTASANALGPAQVRRSFSVSRAARARIVQVSPERDPVRYAAQMEALNVELDSISSREASLRDFRATGTGPGLTIGLQFDAPCDGITTDNAIAQLEMRRRGIEEQIDELQVAARQNGVSPAVFQNPAEILQAAQKPLSPGQERAELRERQSELIGKLDGVQNQLAGMSNAAAAQGITLLPVTPNWGGNLTTNRIQSLDERASQIQNAISENEEAARRAGLAPTALP